MLPKNLTEIMDETAHEKPEHGDHSHANVHLSVIFLGGMFLVNSYIIEYFFDKPEMAMELSALVGALLLGVPIIITAIKDTLSGKVFMNELVALALLAAFIDQDYRTAGAVAFFMLIAILIEHKTAIGAKDSIESLIRLTPKKARLLNDSGEESEVEALNLKTGNIVVIRPGEAFPADGEIVKGNTTVNQASITGESLPVDKDVKGEIFAGTQNLTGFVHVRVTRVGSDTTLGKVRDLIQDAEKTKLPIMRMVDKYAGYYLPTILMIAAMVLVFSDFDMKRVVAVLVVACPCAIVVATPSAVIAAIASAARLGILIKDVSHIELASRIKAIVFDKTGTLTEGNLEVSQLKPVEGVELAQLLKVAVSAESKSNHPAAKAMIKLATEANVEIEEPDEYTEVAGKGVVAEFKGSTYRVGRKIWLKECGIQSDVLDIEGENTVGKSVVYVALDQKVLGYISLSDAIRPASKIMIEELAEMGIPHTCMVTGDNKSVAEVVSKEIGIKHVEADCLPQEKVDYVEKLKAQGKITAVVGDGVNDAPALAAGDIGIAMGAIGSDIAVNSASIALMNNDLRRIPFLIKLSRNTKAIMMQNLLLGLITITGGLYLSTIGLMSGVNAAILHTLSTLIIIMNSARLVRQGESLEMESSIL